MILAQVGDKVPASYIFWLAGMRIAGVLVPLAFLKPLRLLGLALAVGCALLAAADVFIGNDPLQDAVAAELGWSYRVHQIAAGFVPVIIYTLVLLLAGRNATNNGSIARHFPVVDVDHRP